MNKEKILASIIELHDSNDVYMTLDVLLITSRVNLNKARFTPDFIHEIVENKDFYIGLPLVCEKEKLEKGKYKQLGHALKKDGTFKTEQIGSYVDYYEKEAEDGEWELFGTVRVFKRFKNVCEAIQELFEDKSLFFSVECYVGEYTKKSDGTREIDVNKENKFFGDAIVSFPAEAKSTAQLLIAEALNNDLGGGELNKTFEDFFKDTKLHFENCELDIYQVQKKVYQKCRDQLGDKMYDYYSTDFGVSFMILQDYVNGDYYRVDYSVNSDDVTISEMYKVTKNYLPVDSGLAAGSTDNKTSNVEDSECNKNSEINKEEENMTLAEVQAKLETAELKIKDLENTVTEKDTVISEKDTKINELSEQVNTLSETVVVKDNEIAELAKSKEELDKINLEKAEVEKAEKKTALKDKYSKLLSEEVIALPEIAEAIENLDEAVLQAKVVESALEKAEATKVQKDEKPETKTMITASRVTDDINLGGDLLSKYITIGK
jgi:hypothetical protein